MHAHDDRDQFIPPRPPGRGRAIALAVLAHLVLVGALTWGVAWKRDSDQPAVVAELWSAVPQQAAPRAEEPPAPPLPPTPPPPAPTPPKAVEPPPKPQPDPREAEIALEREKRLEKEKREREAKQEQERQQKRLKEQQRLEQEKKDKQAKEKAEHERIERAKEQQRLAEERRKKDESLAKASEKAAKERRDQILRRMQGLANATGGANASGTALRDSGPSGSYGGKVAAKVKPNIVYPDAVADNLRAVVEVQAAPDGTITRTRLKESSGNKAWDDAVLRALQKTETLPRDVDGRVPATLEIGFRPRD
jgi:colicin import membrane protein